MIADAVDSGMHKVLIANRGEIACRLAIACREAGLACVAVYATPDAAAPHVFLADEAIHLPGDTPATTYLDAGAILAAAAATGADAVHPGYGFLSESASFARQVAAAGLVWIGPPAGAIERMGDKLEARLIAAAAGLPVLAGGTLEAGGELPAGLFPVMVKASHGGGGIGLRHVAGAAGLADAMARAGAQAAAAFGSGALYWERYLPGARHVEVQVLADATGA